MIPALLQTTLATVVETIFNQLLALDPAALSKLQTLAGRSIQVRCEQPEIIVTATVVDQGLSLSGNSDIPADATVAGKPLALLKLLTTRNTANLHRDGVTLGGDMGLVNALQEIFGSMDVDWEYHLGQLLGDVPTQLISDGVAGAGKFARRASANLVQDIDDYLHEEKKLFPTSGEVEKLYAAIYALSLRVDRLRARTEILSSRLS